MFISVFLLVQLSVTNTAHGGTTASVQFQKPGNYGTHAYGTGKMDVQPLFV